MKLELEVNEIEAGYLVAAVSEFCHRMRAAEEEGALVPDLSERVITANRLWQRIERQVGVSDWK